MDTQITLNDSDIEEQTTEEQQTQPTEQKFGCEHYERKCQIKCPKCTKYYPCRLCHDDQETHQLDRFKIETIKCLICHEEQPASPNCRKCHIQFSNYYCNICHLWATTTETSGIQHCQDCGFCRKFNPKQPTTHCKTCKCCISQEHTCKEDMLSGRCAICLDDFFNSTRPTHLPCKHIIHRDCLANHIKNRNYRCPTCQKSIGNLEPIWEQYREFLSMEQLPDPYPYWKSEIDCQDCNKQSIVKFHYQLHECAHCHSFNTPTVKSHPSRTNRSRWFIALYNKSRPTTNRRSSPFV